MPTSKVTVHFSCPVERVWQTVTDLSNTNFTVTACEPLRRWAFTMENGNMSGSWEGIFETAEDGTRLHCTETVNAKRWWMRPFAPGYLRRQQRLYLDDLRRELQK